MKASPHADSPDLERGWLCDLAQGAAGARPNVRAMSAPERILVIEDDDALREDLVVLLRYEGYFVQACASGLDALEMAHQQNFDLVVSDVRMAGMDGLETLERLQQQQPSVATLVISGYTAEVDSIRAVRLGVGDYLKKPFDLGDFLVVVARQLTLHRARKVRAQRELSLRNTAVWALETLAEVVAPEAQASQAGRLALDTAREMGLGMEAAGHAQMALLVELSRKAAPQKVETGRLPGELLSILEELEDPTVSPETLSLPARIAQVAVTSDLEPDTESTLATAWERARMRSQVVPTSPVDHRRRAGLLQLARSCEHQGDNQALQHFQSLVQQGFSDREQVEALLGLTRLCTGEPQRCLGYAQQAVGLARSLNGLLGADCALRAGLTLLQAGLRQEAVSSFEQAGRVSRELGQPVLEAKALLALGVAGQEPDRAYVRKALSTLLEVSERFELLDSSGWLTPYLLRLQIQNAEELAQKALHYIGRDTPATFLRLLRAGSLEPEARLLALEALKDRKHPDALECLKMLAADSDARVRSGAEAIVRSASGPLQPPTLRIYAFGAFEVFWGDEHIPNQRFPNSKQRFLLARLAGVRRPVPAERIIDEFWPDTGEGGRSSLNVSVYQLRKVLRRQDWPEELDYISRDHLGLQLNSKLPVWYDVNEFVSLANVEGQAPEEAISRWKRAIHLYRGPCLDSCYLDWAVATRESLEATASKCLLALLEALTQQQRAAELLEYATRLLELDSLCQEAHLAAMRAHLWQGRPEASIRQFELCKKVLARELRLEPSIALLEAQQRALLSIP